jgi:type IV pilus assembly protein PilO
MSRISDLPKSVQIGCVAVLAIVLTAALYFTFYRPLAEKNSAEQKRLAARQVEVQNLKRYENELPKLNQQIVLLRQQVEIQQRILPDEKEADNFIHLMQNTARGSGIEIRRWTAKPVAAREYYTEVPFELEVDGPYYALLSFFQKVGQLERIINVAGLQLGALKGEGAKPGRYAYAPNETVVGQCTAITFFSRDPNLAGKGAAAPKAAAK